VKTHPGVEFPVYLLTAQLENGLFWSEGLYFPEVSRLAGRPPLEPLLGSLKKHLEGMNSLQWSYRQRPRKIKIQSFAVDVVPPKRSGLWQQPFHLEVWGVMYRLDVGPGVWAAHLPQLGLEATAATPQELTLEVAREVRGELVRRQQLSEVLELILLQRWRGLQGRSARLEVRAQRNEGSDEKESQLTKLTSRLQGGRVGALESEASLCQLAELLVEQNVLLVGPSGVGKSALLCELIRRRHEFQLAATPFFETSGSRLLVGEAAFGGWQERCDHLLAELSKLKAIVHLGNLQELLESARHQTNPYGIAGFLRPYLAGRQVQAVVEATPEQLAYVEREYPQFLESFTVLTLDPSDGRRTRAILAQLFPTLVAQTHEAVAELHERFASTSAAPGWPVRFLRAVLRHHERPQRSEVVGHFSRQTGLPLLFLEDRIPFRKSQVMEWFGQRLHGQDTAVERVVDRLAAFKGGLTRPHRPIASFLLIGPTGVGKTELARCLAEFVFQDRNRLTRLDMSEYADAWSVKRLIGGEEIGLLVARVRDRPFQVLLLDEIEKAHPDFFDLLLQVLGDARLSDSRGRVADFSNCLILMTSNLGADRFHKGPLGLREPAQQSGFMEAVRAAFRPELLNRIDEIVPFAPLSPDSVLRICQQELARLPAREALRNRQVEVTVAEGVDVFLATQGYHKLYGARPLKRTLDGLLLAPLSRQLNLHPAQVPLQVHIQLDGGQLSVQARPLQSTDKASAAEEHQRKLNESFSELRRTYHRLLRGAVLTELRNEKVRHERRCKQAWPHHGFLQSVTDLGPAIEELEEMALSALHEPRLFATLPERSQQLNENLKATMVRAFCLTQDEPHLTVLALFSEHTHSLLQLFRAYLSFLQTRPWSLKVERVLLRKGSPPLRQPALPERLVEAHALRPLIWTEQGWTRSPQLERQTLVPARFLEPPGGELPAIGYVLEVSGKNCAPLLNSEAGLHVHRHKGREFKILVETSRAKIHSGDPDSPYAPPAYEPPPDIHRKGVISNPVVTRTYNQDEHLVTDSLGWRVPLDDPSGGWGPALHRLLPRRLQRRAEEAVLR
jgi:ATP-dependent Clp protease ATP-binding subunit ClpA